MKKIIVLLLIILTIFAACKRERPLEVPRETVAKMPSVSPETQEPDASLTLEGAVTVNGKAATNGMALKQGDVVATEDGEAELIFFDGSVTRLEPHSQVVVTQFRDGNVKLEQTAGKTWTRVLKLGIDSYEVTTPA